MTPPGSSQNTVSDTQHPSPDKEGHHEHHASSFSIHSRDSESPESPVGEKNGVWSQEDVDQTAVDPQNTAELGMSRTQSRASSTHPRPLVVVPRKERRGLLGRFAIVPEVVNPYDYKRSTKWGITATIAIATAAAPLGSSIFYREYLHISLFENDEQWKH